VPSYAGTVQIFSSDGAAVLPPNATLTNGTRNFSVTLKTSGNQTVTAKDTLNAVVDGSATVAVGAGPAASLA
jgi:hypothetical protein